MGSTIDIHSFGALRTVQNGSARFRAISPHFPPGSPLIYCCPDAHYSPIPPSTPKSPPPSCPPCQPPLQDSNQRKTTKAFDKMEKMQEELGLKPGSGFCSQMFGDEAEAMFNQRELLKLDIECAKLADPRLEKWLFPRSCSSQVSKFLW